MAEEQIDKLTIEIESVDGDTKALEKARKQLEKLGRIDLSGTIKQIGNLRQALGYLGSVDDSVKSMLDNVAKLGLRASSATALKKTLNDAGKSARQTKEEIAAVVDESIRMMNVTGRASPSGAEAPRTATVTNPSAYGYDKDAMRYIDNYVESIDRADGRQKNAKRSAEAFGQAAKKSGKEASDAMEDTEKKVNKVTKSTSQMAKTFASVIRYRIVGTIIQSVTESAKEGITALGEFDAEFKDTLNTYSASSKAAGGSIALTLDPALSALVPIVEYLADGIGSLGNTVGLVKALLTGEGEYRAVKSVEQIKKELAASEESAKNLRQLISGFDELNLFQKKDSGESVIDIYENKAVKDELGGLSDSAWEDISALVELASVAGIAGVAVKGLSSLFGKKNKTLEEQTDLTNADAKATEALGDVAKAVAPSVLALGTALLGLLGMKLPTLDADGITVPVSAAGAAVGGLSGALGTLGSQKTEPSISVEGLIEQLGLAKRETEAYTGETEGIFARSSEAIETTWSDSLTFIVGLAEYKFRQVGDAFSDTAATVRQEWNALLAELNGGETYEVQTGMVRTAMTRLFGDEHLKASSQTSASGAVPTPAATGVTLPSLFGEGSFIGTYGVFPSVTDVLNDAYASEYDQTVAKNRVKNYVEGALEEIGGAIESAFSTGAKITGAIGRGMIGAYANGGIVSSGEVFMARENGIPEFVGSFGGQTAVANNEQITEGIAGAVESVLAAYIPQIITAIEQNAASVNIGDDQIARAASRGAAAYQRRTGRPMFT